MALPGNALPERLPPRLPPLPLDPAKVFRVLIRLTSFGDVSCTLSKQQFIPTIPHRFKITMADSIAVAIEQHFLYQLMWTPTWAKMSRMIPQMFHLQFGRTVVSQNP